MTLVCELCGEPMPVGEESFKYHGHSGPCPKPPKPVPKMETDYERGRRDMAREVFALHEDTVERYHAIAERDTEGKQGAFARGRITEAKSIAKAIGGILPTEQS